jgi:hypothetical protein
MIGISHQYAFPFPQTLAIVTPVVLKQWKITFAVYNEQEIKLAFYLLPFGLKAIQHILF